MAECHLCRATMGQNVEGDRGTAVGHKSRVRGGLGYVGTAMAAVAVAENRGGEMCDESYPLERERLPFRF